MKIKSGFISDLPVRARIRLNDTSIYIRVKDRLFQIPVNIVRTSEVNANIPFNFFKLMLTGVEDAWSFLEKVSKTEILPEAKSYLLSEAACKGFKYSSDILDEYLKNAPNGSPKIYSFFEQERSLKSSMFIDVTDGKFCVRLVSLFDEIDYSKFPPNVYIGKCNPFSIKKTDLNIVSKNLEDFFDFTKSLCLLGSPGTSRIRKCFDMYFEDTQAAKNLLREIQEDREHRMEVDKVCKDIMRKGIVEVKGGYIVYIKQHGEYYFVMENGRVVRIIGGSSRLVKENVLKLYKGMQLDGEWFSESISSEDLFNIISIIGKVRPDLVVAI
jgi:hypothetical protein